MTWNSLTDNLRDPSLSTDSFRHQLKTFSVFKLALVCIQRITDIFSCGLADQFPMVRKNATEKVTGWPVILYLS